MQLLDGLQLARGDSQNADLPSDNVNISDVLDAVVLADPANGAVAVGGGSVEMTQRPPAPQQATVQIVEQPAPKALRFRYECEGRSAGSIPGVNSTSENKTYPTIRINGFRGQATIVVSCVTKDRPHMPHPHNLVGREGCQRGVFTIKAAITPEANEYQFRNLGIQCVKRRDIADALQQRAVLRVDPFRTGFEHRNNPQSIDLNAVRLAFQVFLHEDGGSGRLYSLPPVVSDIIYDKKAMCDLLIMRASHCSGPVAGGTQIILLCEKVTREDTAVVFYQEDDAGNVIWEAPANTVLIHKQVAIVFETPPYTPYERNAYRGQILVRFQLRRISDKLTSNSLEFEYIPPKAPKRKTPMHHLVEYEDSFLNVEQPGIKMEPNRTPPHMYPQPTTSYSEAPAQWAPLEPLPAYGEGWPPQAQYQQYGQASYLRSPHPQPGQPGSPMGPVSPATQAGLMSPMAPTHGGHSPHLSHGGQSPHVVGHGGHSPQQVGPGGPALSPGLQYQQGLVQSPTPSYQMQMAGGEQMDTGPSISALLNQNVAPMPDYDLLSLNSLEQNPENLSDSLKNLSTTDLFRH